MNQPPCPALPPPNISLVSTPEHGLWFGTGVQEQKSLNLLAWKRPLNPQVQPLTQHCQLCHWCPQVPCAGSWPCTQLPMVIRLQPYTDSNWCTEIISDKGQGGTNRRPYSHGKKEVWVPDLGLWNIFPIRIFK